MLPDLLILKDQLFKGNLTFPRLHGTFLNQIIRGFPQHSAADQGQEDLLGVREIIGHAHGTAHVFRIHKQVLQDTVHGDEHMLKERGGIRQDDPFNR